MNNSISNFYKNQPVITYEESHVARLNFLVEDLKLNEYPKEYKIADFGCGYGTILNRITNIPKCNKIGFDGAIQTEGHHNFIYLRKDLSDYDEYYTRINFSTIDKQCDVGLCFETLEHLTNPYNCIKFIKSVVKPNGIIHISIPHESITHNTIYPGLLYPAKNFIEFLEQMALPIERHVIHDKAFKQEVFTCRNAGWDECKMKWHKNNEKFRNIEPLEAVNL